jgi:hypothetical protein
MALLASSDVGVRGRALLISRVAKLYAAWERTFYKPRGEALRGKIDIAHREIQLIISS